MRKPYLIGTVLLVTLGIALAVGAAPQCSPYAPIGYATYIYKGTPSPYGDRWGIEFQCQDQSLTKSDANNCAMSWCSKWKDADRNHTGSCFNETLQQAHASHQVDFDDAASPQRHCNYKK